MSLPRHALERLYDVGKPLCAEGGLDAVDLGRYQLGRELGRGGMGVVYEAHDPELGRRVALKVLSRAAGLSTEARLRFAREAKAAAQLTHPNIAAVYDATPEAIAMQLIDGVALSALAGTDPRDLSELVRDAALAVHTAHQQGIVHRDLKPANLMVERRAGQRPHVYVMDFGLAKAADLDASLSSSGGVLGTPHYMAPEQAAGRGAEVDARSDVYSLGATLFSVLAGRPPFEGDDVYEVLRRTVEEEPPDVRRLAPAVDGDLATIVAKCLRKEPEARYPSALALASDLDRWLRGEPVVARPVSAAGVRGLSLEEVSRAPPHRGQGGRAGRGRRGRGARADLALRTRRAGERRAGRRPGEPGADRAVRRGDLPACGRHRTDPRAAARGR